MSSATSAKGGAPARTDASRPWTWGGAARAFAGLNQGLDAARFASSDGANEADFDDAVGVEVEPRHFEVREHERRFGEREIPRGAFMRRRGRSAAANGRGFFFALSGKRNSLRRFQRGARAGKNEVVGGGVGDCGGIGDRCSGARARGRKISRFVDAET